MLSLKDVNHFCAKANSAHPKKPQLLTFFREEHRHWRAYGLSVSRLHRGREDIYGLQVRVYALRNGKMAPKIGLLRLGDDRQTASSAIALIAVT